MRLYHGHETELPRRYVARQRLCLRGTTDYFQQALLLGDLHLSERRIRALVGRARDLRFVDDELRRGGQTAWGEGGR